MAEYPDHETEGVQYIRLQEPARVYVVQVQDGAGTSTIAAVHAHPEEAERSAAAERGSGRSAIVTSAPLKGPIAEESA